MEPEDYHPAGEHAHYGSLWKEKRKGQGDYLKK